MSVAPSAAMLRQRSTTTTAALLAFVVLGGAVASTADAAPRVVRSFVARERVEPVQKPARTRAHRLVRSAAAAVKRVVVLPTSSSYGGVFSAFGSLASLGP